MQGLRRTTPTLILLLAFVSCVMIQANAYTTYYWGNVYIRCYGKTVTCPYECPSSYSEDPKAKVCYVNVTRPFARHSAEVYRKPNCNSPGSACYDPRFIGGDGVVFYFHGKSNEHFSLVSDINLQINGRFIGHGPAGRTGDYTWIQALGILLNSHSFTVESTKVATWDNQVDHLQFTYNGEALVVPEGHLSIWYSPQKDIKVERISSKNSVVVSLKDTAEILVNVVPITREDDRVHNSQLLKDDFFAHLEVQFRFFSLTPKVEGVLGRTYRPDFENPAKPGVAMPVLGGEDKYRTTSLIAPDFGSCLFTKEGVSQQETIPTVKEYGFLDCTKVFSGGHGIVCKK
ncbi:hypothetical protein FNV43_RR04067 [Rhamnella rubrinervis]|uniref:Uncharacterized protein n=1 Tax=Rhamnella rubrinervis TaxID=2594499 RepID=A0A8K0HJJ1_9ROSA|nr:hypothetical protein FNV43_RR04067 [Rhamnella rubrinervis]